MHQRATCARAERVHPLMSSAWRARACHVLLTRCIELCTAESHEAAKRLTTSMTSTLLHAERNHVREPARVDREGRHSHALSAWRTTGCAHAATINIRFTNSQPVQLLPLAHRPRVAFTPL